LNDEMNGLPHFGYGGFIYRMIEKIGSYILRVMVEKGSSDCIDKNIGTPAYV